MFVELFVSHGDITLLYNRLKQYLFVTADLCVNVVSAEFVMVGLSWHTDDTFTTE